MVKKIFISAIFTIISALPLFSAEYEKLWGISRTDFSGLKINNCSTFRPEDKPGYSNKIIDFFSSMNPEERTPILIIRAQGKPETDYCFFNEKLYSVSEEWGNIDKIKTNDLIKTLKEKYSEISTEEQKPYIVHTFKKGKTKVLLYKKIIDEKSAQVRIFYYSNDLFNVLFSE